MSCHKKAGNYLMGSLCKYLFVCLLALSLVACNGKLETSKLVQEQADSVIPKQGKITEVSPPEVIQQLRLEIDSLYQPQVSITSPQKDAVLEDSTVSVTVDVKDFKIFQSKDLGLGPHLELIVDNQIKRSIYSTKDPVVLENLAPGTHTLRLFAVKPWGESFKNDGAYAETTFHLYSKTGENAPTPGQPLLTFNQPQGIYMGEPVLLDFYLTNAPLHLVAKQSEEDAIENWRIKVTTNGETFYLDRWEPIYLAGFSKGKNWVQLEYINEKGVPINNTFNNTVRVIEYQADETDPLSRLMRNEIPLDQARAIVDPDYQKPLPAEPDEPVTPEIDEPSATTVEPDEPVTPEIEEPSATTVEPQESVTPETEEPSATTVEPQEPVAPEIDEPSDTTAEPDEPVTPEIEEPSKAPAPSPSRLFFS